MNFKQLEVFVAVAESRSFSKGADAACISQSTASQHIAALEESCGVRLLDRTGKGAVPTEAGKLLLQHGRKLLAVMKKTESAMARFVGGHEAELAVGGSTIPCTYLLPRIIRQLMASAPTLVIRTRQGDSREVAQLLVREEVEVAVVGSLMDNDALTFEPLTKDSIRLVVGRQHPWYGVDRMTLDDLQTEPLVLREEGSGTGKAVQTALHEVGFDPGRMRVRAWMGSSEAVKQAVMLGIGASFLSDLSILSELERGELSVVEISGVAIERMLYLAHRRGRDLSPAAKAFCAAARELFPPTGDVTTPPPL